MAKPKASSAAPKSAKKDSATKDVAKARGATKAPSAAKIAVAAPLADITVGCAGFPGPATRYFEEFLFVEVQDTHVAMPGMGTIRRWRREAPPGFKFAMLSPREIGADGFKTGKITDTALKALADVGKELESTIAVFVAPPEFTASKPNKLAVKEFLKYAKKKFTRIIWEPPPSWSAAEAEAIAEEAGAIAARDPLAQGTSDLPVAYYRLPGPAGHKSRYEDPAIEKLAELARKAKNKEATYVFTNVDMFADAKRLKKALKIS